MNASNLWSVCTEALGSLRSYYLQVESEVEESLVGQSSQTVGYELTQLVSKLNCRTPSGVVENCLAWASVRSEMF